MPKVDERSLNFVCHVYLKKLDEHGKRSWISEHLFETAGVWFAQPASSSATW